MSFIPKVFCKKITAYLQLLRVDRPTGIWLLFLPCMWGMFLALSGNNVSNANDNFISAGHESTSGLIAVLFDGSFFESDAVKYVLLFLLGSFVMRSAGCVINDIADRKFDEKVARTKRRPLACGDLSVQEAAAVLLALLLCGLAILLQFNKAVVNLGFVAVVLVFIYPLMKRVTYYPQAFLGAVFNFGALMGYAAVAGSIDLAAATLYFAALFWTLGYDTIYAYQDMDDDIKVGVKSVAVRFGTSSKKHLYVFYGLMASLLALAGVVGSLGTAYFVILAVAAGYSLQQVYKVNLQDGQSCMRIFKLNVWIGVLALAAIIAG